jgi:prepilin-type N-terminal cleavage/methylation domain-containing protein
MHKQAQEQPEALYSSGGRRTPVSAGLEGGVVRRDDRGFTLVELLVVIAIIGVLVTMVTATVGKVRQRAAIVAAQAGISSISTAIAAYNTREHIYPGAVTAKGQTPKDDPDALFRALYTANPKVGGSRDNHLEDWSPSDIAVWPGSYLTQADAVYAPATEDQLDFSTGYKTPCVLLDYWGRPYHYVEWDSHPTSARQLPGSSLKAIGAKPFFIWSDGPDMTNEYGGGDDVTSWGGRN